MLCIIIILNSLAYGQDYQIKEKKVVDEFIWRNSTQYELDSFYLDLPNVKKSEYKTYIRIYLTSQIIDLYSNDNKEYSGIIINKINENRKIKTNCGWNSKLNKIVFQRILIDSLIAKKVATYILSSGIDSIPTDSMISSWNKSILDCGGITFQFNKNDDYIENYYTCPWGQNDSTKYIDLVLKNYNFIYQELNLEKLYNSFKTDLPLGKEYSYGMRVMYKLTKREMKSWNRDKPRREYLKSVKNTIDKLLEYELSKKNNFSKEINCYSDFSLYFGKNGKLKKIKIYDCDKPQLFGDGLEYYIEEKKDIMICKKIIKELFKETGLGFLKLKYGFYRKFSFNYKGEYHIADDNFY